MFGLLQNGTWSFHVALFRDSRTTHRWARLFSKHQTLGGMVLCRARAGLRIYKFFKLLDLSFTPEMAALVQNSN
jgi:hypothetical protein